MNLYEHEHLTRALLRYVDARVDERLGTGNGHAVQTARSHVRGVLFRATKNGLSPRERETLELMAEGLTNQQIAVRMGITPQCVKNHVTHVFQKLEVGDRVSAVITAMRWGILDPIRPDDEGDTQ